MTITAFVARSFNKEDEDICRQFCDFFDNLHSYDPDFSYQTARKAEPKEVSEKVRRIIDSSDLFIGICTRHHARTELPSISKFPWVILQKIKMKAYCSEWIMQEAAYSLAQDKPIILLVEKGIEKPTVFGINLEYISFDRSAPEKCYAQIQEMLSSLKPKLPRTTKSLPATNNEQEKEASLITKPANEWTKNEFKLAIIEAAMLNKNIERIDEVLTEYKQTNPSENELDLMSAYCLYHKMIYFNEGALSELLSLQEKYGDSPEINSYLAEIYERYKDHEKSIKYNENIVLSKKSSEFSRFSAKCSIAEMIDNHKRGGDLRLINDLIQTYNNLPKKDSYVKEKLFDTIMKISPLNDLAITRTSMLEDALSENPTDDTIRMKLALQYSDSKQHDLSYFHNTILAKEKRNNEYAINNLGVDALNLNLKWKAMKLYEEAIDLNNTMAEGNLASCLAQDGYSSKARAIIEQASTKPNHDKKNHEILSFLDEKEKEEDSKSQSILDKASSKQKFIKRYASAVLSGRVASLNGIWSNDNMELQLNTKDFNVNGSGKFIKISGNGLFTGLLNTHNENRAISIKGKIIGNAVECVITETLDGSKTSIWDNIETRTVALFLPVNDGETIHVCELDSKNDAKFYSLTRSKQTA